VDDLRPDLEHGRLLGRRLQHLGRRLARAARRGRLLGRLRHPLGRRRLGLRRCGDGRSAHPGRPQRLRTQQLDHRAGWRRYPLAPVSATDSAQVSPVSSWV
jgi:hypothetical protein